MAVLVAHFVELLMNSHYQAILIERDRAETRLKNAEVSGATFYEYRVLLRELEHLEHQLKAFECMKGMLPQTRQEIGEVEGPC